jgi:NAD(P)H-nitrite reductase large subunit
MTSMPRHHVIVGSGIAGLAAAEALRSARPTDEITLISEEPHPFYSRPGLAYLLRGDIPERQLHIRKPDHLRDLKVNRITAVVEQLSCAEHELLLSDRKKVRYDRLLIATGALAVPPNFPGADLAGIVKLDGLDDARRIMKQTGKRKTAVVIGGGITALELVEGLHAQGMTVHYFLRGARYWSDILDETESSIVLGRLKHEGVILHLNTQIKEALGLRGRLTAVETQDGKRIACQLLAVAIGVRPRADLAKKAGLKVERGVVVNEFLQTSAADVYAAGDVAEVRDPRTGAVALDVLWPSALAMGQAAGANMAGANIPYFKAVPLNVTQLTGLKVTIIGAVGGGKNEDLVAITRGESEAWRLLPKAWVLSDRDDVNRVRLLVGEDRIIGALVMGDQTWSRPLQRLISAEADITPIREALTTGKPDALTQLGAFYQHWERTQARGGRSS